MKERVTPNRFTDLLRECLPLTEGYVVGMRIDGDENGYWLVAPGLSPSDRSALLKRIHDQVAEHNSI